MIDLSNQYLLMIEPEFRETPLIMDNLSEIARLVYDKATTGTRYKGLHTCICGMCSDSADHILPNGVITNSLMVHYIKFHRDEVPIREIAKLVDTAIHVGVLEIK